MSHASISSGARSILCLRDAPATDGTQELVDTPTPNQRIVHDPNQLTSERLRRLYAYWASLKGERIAPSRSELNPADMRDQLGWIWLMDVIDGGEDFRFRLGGDRVIQFFGQRLSGMLLSRAMPGSPEFFSRFRNLVRLAALNALPASGGPAQTAYQPRAYLEIEALMLPLSDDGRTVSGILGGIELRPLTVN